jgi:hypothetical protein
MKTYKRPCLHIQIDNTHILHTHTHTHTHVRVHACVCVYIYARTFTRKFMQAQNMCAHLHLKT